MQDMLSVVLLRRQLRTYTLFPSRYKYSFTAYSYQNHWFIAATLITISTSSIGILFDVINIAMLQTRLSYKKKWILQLLKY